MKNNFTIESFDPGGEKRRAQKLWLQSFLIYAALEMLILGIQYAITKSKCSVCVLPPAFYVVNWVQHILFTGLLWFCLNQFYNLVRWKIILVNLILFLTYYFLWITAIWIIFHSDKSWLVRDNIPNRTFESLIHASWSDIGKYVVKLSAFYVVKFYFEYRKAERQRVRLAVINKDIQINLLKEQLSPHFYFNTLNNLYGLARSNSSKLPGALQQLADIMQYIIVDCNQPKVLLSQEINFLRSYIALEKLRYEQNVVIDFNIKGTAGNLAISPLLLIQFVENAFKHGMKEKSDRSWMIVSMNIEKEELFFTVENSYYEKKIADGIGISSVKEILNLQYEGKYNMEMLHEDNRFLVTLKLNLS